MTQSLPFRAYSQQKVVSMLLADVARGGSWWSAVELYLACVDCGKSAMAGHDVRTRWTQTHSTRIELFRRLDRLSLGMTNQLLRNMLRLFAKSILGLLCSEVFWHRTRFDGGGRSSREAGLLRRLPLSWFLLPRLKLAWRHEPFLAAKKSERRYRLTTYYFSFR